MHKTVKKIEKFSKKISFSTDEKDNLFITKFLSIRTEIITIVIKHKNFLLGLILNLSSKYPIKKNAKLKKKKLNSDLFELKISALKYSLNNKTEKKYIKRLKKIKKPPKRGVGVL